MYCPTQPWDRMGTMLIVYLLIVLPTYEHTVFDWFSTNLMVKLLPYIQFEGKGKLHSCMNYFQNKKVWKEMLTAKCGSSNLAVEPSMSSRMIWMWITPASPVPTQAVSGYASLICPPIWTIATIFVIFIQLLQVPEPQIIWRCWNFWLILFNNCWNPTYSIMVWIKHLLPKWQRCLWACSTRLNVGHLTPFPQETLNIMQDSVTPATSPTYSEVQWHVIHALCTWGRLHLMCHLPSVIANLVLTGSSKWIILSFVPMCQKNIR